LAPLDAGAGYGWFTGRSGGKEATSGVDPLHDSEASIAYDLTLPERGLWRIRWNSIPRLPDGWSLRFHDLAEGVELDVMEEDGYGFIHSGNAGLVEGRFLFIARKAITTIIEPEPILESPQSLSAWPNPFNPTTVISYRVGTQDLASLQVRLSVYDLLGREVAVLVDGVRPAGEHQVRFNASTLASGVYLIRLETAGSSTIQRITLLK